MDSKLLAFVRENLDLNQKIVYLLDYKKDDVTGDGIIDKIYLVGNKESPDAIFAENITLVVKDGHTGEYITASLESNAGYGARLFIGDFNKDQIKDVLVSIDSGGSGGLAFYYIYSFEDGSPSLLFDYESFNQSFEYEVNYKDFYKVEVINVTLNKSFIIDISGRDPEYLSEIYRSDGRLKEPLSGYVVPLGSLWPIVSGREGDNYDLLAVQRVIGRFNADTLGYPHTYLTWDRGRFESIFYTIGLVGEEYY